MVKLQLDHLANPPDLKSFLWFKIRRVCQMVKLELYRVFREVAEAGNISLAAENLYLSQSAVSQSVKQLEQQLRMA